MTQAFSIPDAATKYILFQRTAYMRYPGRVTTRILRKLIPWLTFERVVAIESQLRSADVKRLYEEDMSREYDSIKHFLPESCRRILDIGCGVAGIDVLLSRHYGGMSPDFYLLDRTRTEEKVFYSYRQRGAFYNSLEVARRMLELNNVAADRIHPLEANDRNEIAIEPPLDLAISLISWGFHNPVDTYLARVHQLLRDGGHLIIDVRKGAEDPCLLKQTFSELAVIGDYRKHVRIRAIK